MEVLVTKHEASVHPPKSNERPERKLHRGHFAFMRALVQGLDERSSWDRYLRLEGEHADLKTVRRTIAWIRDAFAAAARREHKPGTARLILLDPDRFAAAPTLPSLAEFALERGLEDFSEAEQIEAYEAAYSSGSASGRGGQGRARPSRRARVIDHQLQALRWLEDLVVQDPRPGDRVAAWLNQSLATRLERAGLPTLRELVERINGVGARWWVQVPGVGERKAARILEWLRAHEAVLKIQVGDHVGLPRGQLTPTALAAVVPAATALVPYEKLVLPVELDGREGRYRAPADRCLLMAANDHEAIGAWLASKRSVAGAVGKGALSSTQRSYRKEAERLLLWSILERRKALSSLAVEDASAFRDFLADPPPSWCGPRHHQRWSPLWRPLEGPLTPAALRQSLIILRSLFAFLISQGYVVGNPFSTVSLPAQQQRPLGSRRTLTFAQWDHINALLRDRAATEVGRRLCRGMRWLYATGLRIAEITGARCEDLEQVEYEAADGTMASGWLLSVVGKGGRSRQMPVPAELVEELGDELVRHGFERQVRAASNLGVHVMARFGTGLDRPPGWSASGLYQAIKAFLVRAAMGLDDIDAQALRKASSHWLKHCIPHSTMGSFRARAPAHAEVAQVHRT